MAYTPISDGDTGLSVREKLNTGLALADTALQPDDVGTAAATDADAYATAAQGAKADSAQQPSALLPIAGYTETGATLTPVAGVLTIPMLGRHYVCTPSAAITTLFPYTTLFRSRKSVV